VAQVCQLRTQLLPQVFAGDPTAVSIASGYKLRTIQWGSDVFVAANFDPAETQTLTLPEGTWYDYLAGASSSTAGGTQLQIAAGELMIFTGTRQQLPSINTSSFASFR